MARPAAGIPPSAIIASIIVLFILGLQVQSCMALPSIAAAWVVGAAVVVATEESLGKFRQIFTLLTGFEGDLLDVGLALPGNIGHRDLASNFL